MTRHRWHEPGDPELIRDSADTTALPLFQTPAVEPVNLPRIPPAIEAEAGRKARNKAIRQVSAAHRELVRRCREAMIQLYQHRTWTMEAAFVNGDDASKWLDAEGFCGERRVIGGVFRPRSGWIAVGTVPSLLKRRHYREVKCWRWAGDLSNELERTAPRDDVPKDAA